MTKFQWTTFISLSMIFIGVNILTHSHDTHEIIVFLGGWAIASGCAIPAIGCFTEVVTIWISRSGKQRSAVVDVPSSGSGGDVISASEKAQTHSGRTCEGK